MKGAMFISVEMNHWDEKKNRSPRFVSDRRRRTLKTEAHCQKAQTFSASSLEMCLASSPSSLQKLEPHHAFYITLVFVQVASESVPLNPVVGSKQRDV